LFPLFAAGIVDTGDKFTASVVCSAPCRWYQQHQQYLWHFTPARKFSKKCEMTLMLFSGPCGKMIHENYLKQKIS
jgi:hypothetical protein